MITEIFLLSKSDGLSPLIVFILFLGWLLSKIDNDNYPPDDDMTRVDFHHRWKRKIVGKMFK